MGRVGDRLLWGAANQELALTCNDAGGLLDAYLSVVERRKAGEPLVVWLTRPVAPAGMPTEAVAAVDAMLGAGVDLAGVNVMTMNYGSSRPGSTTMAPAGRQALEASHPPDTDVPDEWDTPWRPLFARPGQ